MSKEFTPGDILYVKTDGYGYLIYKLLKIETRSDGTGLWHLMPFEALDHEPTQEDIPQLKIRGMHVPIDAFPDRAVVIGHVELTEDDFEGYNLYQEHMNRA